MDFTCNICGTRNSGVEEFGREVETCAGCKSSVRIRSLLYAFSQELFGAPIPLPHFPVLKSLRGLGMTDSRCYAEALARCFDYKNTFYDQQPRLDVSDVDGQPEGALDFLISSEVFEHVRPPLEAALKNAFRLLAPNGVLVFTMPWGLDIGPPSMEHFPSLSDYGLAQLRSGPVLINRTAEGELQVFENLVFHLAATPALELRRVTVKELRRMFSEAGFSELRFYTEEYAEFGIRHPEPWSLPVAARKQPLQLSQGVRAELMGQYKELRSTVESQKAIIQGCERENRELTELAEQRTAWARSLEEELQAERRRLAELESELVRRTEWAQSLEQELERCQTWGAVLQTELESRTTWAQDLDRQLQDRTKWATESSAHLQRVQENLGALRASWWNRLGRLLRVVR